MSEERRVKSEEFSCSSKDIFYYHFLKRVLSSKEGLSVLRLNRGKRRGLSYKKRVADINAIYDRYAKLGVPNRDIWRRYIYPTYAISERQFYYILKASADPRNELTEEQELFLNFED